MKLILLLLALICASKSIGVLIPANIEPFSKELVDYINHMNTTWKAALNFEGIYTGFVNALLGVDSKNYIYRLPIIFHEENLAIPETFDARTQWPNCYSIREIRDQGECGSGWAYGAVETISDRICIASQGKKQVDISAKDLISCCDSCGFGCEGGYPSAAWQYWVDSGIVSGGLYGNNKGCKPYTVKSCEYHTKGPLPHCDYRKNYPTPICVHVCEKGYNVSYTEDKHFGANAYGISSNVTQIQIEIMKNGPVEADFTVYSDFPIYKSGVYQRHSEMVLGIHAVRVLGWGVESNVEYWLVANSWNTDWADNGYFKIRRGTNECGFEDDINAGLPRA